MEIDDKLEKELNKLEKDTFKLVDAYWLSPKGKVHEVNQTHIMFILDNPELFKTTKIDLVEVYKKYKEKIGWEGKAREEILTEALKKGWVRIRDYGNNGWSLQVWELDNYTKNVIWKWAAKSLELIGEGKKVYDHNRIIITVLKNIFLQKPNHTWTVNLNFGDVIKGKLEESKLLEKLEDKKYVTLKDFENI